MLIMTTDVTAVENRPYVTEDVKVRKICSDSTSLSRWKTYYFTIKGMDLFPLIHKEDGEDGVFRFWSLCPKTLKEAKQHIADCFNAGLQL